jgi:hypothetical protein
MSIQPKTLRKIGLAVGLCGLPLFLIGAGTTVDYLCCQSHPVPVAVAFSLKIEFTLAGLLLMLTGFGLVLVPPLPSS